MACPTQATSQAVRTGSPRSGAMRLGMCSTSGQVVITASRIPASAISRTSLRVNVGEGAQRSSRTRAGAGSPASAAGVLPGEADDPDGVRGGLGRPVLMVCRCLEPRGSAQHTAGACDIAAHGPRADVTFRDRRLRQTGPHEGSGGPVSYTHLRAHETDSYL